MKFSPRAIQVLRNFSTINEGLIFKTGSRIKTMSPSRSILAAARIDSDVETQFAIGELNQFLAALSLFEDPEIVIQPEALDIKGENGRMLYRLADPSVIYAPSEKEIRLPDPEVSFILKNDVLSRVMKAMGIVGAPTIAVAGDGEKIYVQTHDAKNSSKSTYRVEVGETDKVFKFIFLADNIKLLPGDYNISISSKGLSHFISEDVEYWIALEGESEYKG